jgi:hypothetical protein
MTRLSAIPIADKLYFFPNEFCFVFRVPYDHSGPGVNFTNVFFEAFTRADPKSAKVISVFWRF